MLYRSVLPGAGVRVEHEAVWERAGHMARHNACRSVPLHLPAAYAVGQRRAPAILPLPEGGLSLIPYLGTKSVPQA